MDPNAVLALCHEHARAEAAEEIDAVLATLVPHPRFEFFPLARAMTGWDTVEHFYREQYPRFAPSVVGYEMLNEWTNEQVANQEYKVDVDTGDGPVTYWVMSMMPIDEETGLLTGERVYSDEGFFRALLGPMFDELEPIKTR